MFSSCEPLNPRALPQKRLEAIAVSHLRELALARMKWLLGAYTGRFNRRHRLFGHLFSGRYKALIVEGSGNG